MKFNKQILYVMLALLFCSTVAITDSEAVSYDSNWFNSLQEAITAAKADTSNPGAPTLSEVVKQAIDSGAQLYVIIQTAMAMDSGVADEIIKTTIEVSRNPDQVIKSAIIANIDIATIVKSSLESGVSEKQIILSAIDAGADMELLINVCIQVGADPEKTVVAGILATRNVQAVVAAAIKAGAPERTIAKAVFTNTDVIDEPQSVIAACINTGIDLYVVVREALDAGLTPGMVIVVSLYTSNDYQKVVDSAITWGITKPEIAAFAKGNLSIDQEALARALDLGKEVQALTYILNNGKPSGKNSISTESNGSVSPY